MSKELENKKSLEEQLQEERNKQKDKLIKGYQRLCEETGHHFLPVVSIIGNQIETSLQVIYTEKNK